MGVGSAVPDRAVKVTRTWASCFISCIAIPLFNCDYLQLGCIHLSPGRCCNHALIDPTVRQKSNITRVGFAKNIRQSLPLGSMNSSFPVSYAKFSSRMAFADSEENAHIKRSKPHGRERKHGKIILHLCVRIDRNPRNFLWEITK